MDELLLFHTGFQVIRQPDITFGRKNADFGQGFYLSDNEEFSKRWARARRGATACLNRYALAPDGLRILRLSRDAQWFDYIFANRAGGADRFSAYDVIVGPIANDTIYDTWGIITSGLLPREQALRLLLLGPVYEQTVIKTERALSALRFLGAEELPEAEVRSYRAAVRQEERAYQEQVARLLEQMTDRAD